MPHVFLLALLLLPVLPSPLPLCVMALHTFAIGALPFPCYALSLASSYNLSISLLLIFRITLLIFGPTKHVISLIPQMLLTFCCPYQIYSLLSHVLLLFLSSSPSPSSSSFSSFPPSSPPLPLLPPPLPSPPDFLLTVSFHSE